MCGRFYIDMDDADDDLQEIIDALQRRGGPAAVKLGEVCPGDQAAVLANNRSMSVRPFAMRWGYAFPDSRPIINARSETAAVKPLFRDGIAQRRCLVPALRYFEWERQAAPSKRRTKYAFAPSGTHGFYMAGIYHLEHGAPAFTILTRQAAPELAGIHDRMPIILPPDIRLAWLDPANDAEEILRSAQLHMDFHAV